MDPFPITIRQLKFLIVGIDYFTKWVEAEALATITEKNVRRFVWRNIICRYGILRVLVSDNEKQFDNDSFLVHPQANRQVEVTNQSLLKIIKTRLKGEKGIWLAELPSVLWVYKTITRTPTGEMMFWLVYGSEALIPAEVGLISYRVGNHYKSRNNEAMRL